MSKQLISISDIISTYKKWYGFTIDYQTKTISFSDINDIFDTVQQIRELSSFIRHRGDIQNTNIEYDCPFSYSGEKENIVVTILKNWEVDVKGKTYNSDNCFIEKTNKKQFVQINSH